MKACLVFLLSALVAIVNVDRNSAHPVTSTGLPVGVTENLLLINKFRLRTTTRLPVPAVPVAAPVPVPVAAPVPVPVAAPVPVPAAAPVPVPVEAPVPVPAAAPVPVDAPVPVAFEEVVPVPAAVGPDSETVLARVNGTSTGNATVFQDPTCALQGNFGCLNLCRNLGFFDGVCDPFGFCACL